MRRIHPGHISIPDAPTQAIPLSTLPHQISSYPTDSTQNGAKDEKRKTELPRDHEGNAEDNMQAKTVKFRGIRIVNQMVMK